MMPGVCRSWLRSVCVAAVVCALAAAGAQAQTQPSVFIAQPAQGATLHDNDGTVIVALRTEGTGFSAMRVLLDGKPYGPSQRTASFVLKDVDRGEHVLEVQLLDATDRVVASSPPVTFYLWRASSRFPSRAK